MPNKQIYATEIKYIWTHKTTGNITRYTKGVVHIPVSRHSPPYPNRTANLSEKKILTPNGGFETTVSEERAAVMSTTVIIRHVISLTGPTPFQTYHHMCLKEPSYGRGNTFHFKVKIRVLSEIGSILTMDYSISLYSAWGNLTGASLHSLIHA